MTDYSGLLSCVDENQPSTNFTVLQKCLFWDHLNDTVKPVQYYGQSFGQPRFIYGQFSNLTFNLISCLITYLFWAAPCHLRPIFDRFLSGLNCRFIASATATVVATLPNLERVLYLL